jgi:adenylylsulfate kinase
MQNDNRDMDGCNSPNGASASKEGLTVWFTGLSSSGKTTLSRAVYELLRQSGHRVEILDGDAIRRELSKELGFSKQDRDENIRRIGFVANLLTRNGVVVLVSAISPYRELRQEMRDRIGRFMEVHVSAPLAICEQRDVKGLYRRARAGELKCFTGIDDPYEPPLHAEVVCRTDLESVAESAQKVLAAIRNLSPEFERRVAQSAPF